MVRVRVTTYKERGAHAFLPQHGQHRVRIERNGTVIECQGYYGIRYRDGRDEFAEELRRSGAG